MLGRLFAILVVLLSLRPLASFHLRQPPRSLLRRHYLAMTMAATDRDWAQTAVLLLSTTEDKASVNLVNALLARGGWEEHEVQGLASDGLVWRRPDAPCPTYLWQIRQGFLRSDFLDTKWTAATGQPLQEIVYLSRHAAASGKPSLTIHPIGNPGQPIPAAGADSEERAEHGGIPGKCVPPSPRMAPLFRLLHAAVQKAGLSDSFEVTLEATHHGPWHGSGTPCCFVEIGSKDEDWGREDAAQVWADVLGQSLGFGSAEPAAPAKPKAMVVGLGGGHYTPKMNDLLRHRDDVLIGHMCAGYCFGGPPEDWQQGILEAVAASKEAASSISGGGDGGEGLPVVLYVDKKAFKSAQRTELLDFLDAQGLPYGFKEAELVELAEKARGTSSSSSVGRV